jgi:uncharacterized LabA/DUF88 family protein
MVDAGYLLRKSIEIVSNKSSKKRTDLVINNPVGLIEMLLKKARSTLQLEGKELLRVYWYDGVMANGYTPQQQAIINVDDVLFRSGTINTHGHQKGIDSLIVADLIELASHRSICDAILVTGDADLAVGMEMAQKYGVRIAVIGVEDFTTGVLHQQSFEISSRADRVGMLGPLELASVIKYMQGTTDSQPMASWPPSVAAPGDSGEAAIPENSQQIQQAVQNFFTQSMTNGTGTITVNSATRRIDPNVDRALMFHIYSELGHGALTKAEKIFAREVFRDLVIAQA